MKNKLLNLSCVLALSVGSGILHAEVNTGVGKEKSASCAGCHGDNGNSMVATFPKLAQQHSSYLVKQLQSFKNGTRNDPMMSSIAQGLKDDDMAAIADYYSSQKITDNPVPVIDPDEDDDDKGAGQKTDAKEVMKTLMAKGSDLYRNGDLTREVSACIACHGPHGEGNKPAAFPALKSQHAEYLMKSLHDFKSGARSNNPENMMHMIARKMTDEEIKAVSYHISTMQ